MPPSMISIRIENDTRPSSPRQALLRQRLRASGSVVSWVLVEMMSAMAVIPLCGGGEIEAAADFGGQPGEPRRGQGGEAPRPRRRVGEHFDDAAGARRHSGR